MANYSDCLEKAGITLFNHEGGDIIGKVIDSTLAKTEEQEFIETLKTLKGWEWELVAKHIPFSLCLERVNKEIARLQQFECDVKCAVKESEN